VPTTPIAALSFQWFGIANHMTVVRWAPLVGAVVISRAAWQTVPADVRSALARSALEAAVRARGKIRPLEEQAIVAMKARGLVVHPVPTDALAEWESVGRSSYPFLTEKVVPAAMVAEVQRLRDEYRAQRRGN